METADIDGSWAGKIGGSGTVKLDGSQGIVAAGIDDEGTVGDVERAAGPAKLASMGE